MTSNDGVNVVLMLMGMFAAPVVLSALGFLWLFDRAAQAEEYR